MRTYQDIDSFKTWTKEEQNQFALAVTKGLIMDIVRKANSGHSGGPMSSADFTLNDTHKLYFFKNQSCIGSSKTETIRHYTI